MPVEIAGSREKNRCDGALIMGVPSREAPSRASVIGYRQIATMGFAVLAALTSFMDPSSARAQTPGLMAAYAFNEGAGTTVADVSGHNSTGTISGATYLGQCRSAWGRGDVGDDLRDCGVGGEHLDALGDDL